MPTPIIFTITTAGRVAALDAFDNGLTIALTEIGIGDDSYTPTGSETALSNELDRFNLSGGTVEALSATLRFSAAITALARTEVYELGLFTSTGVLFAVASTTSTTVPLVVAEANIDTICAFGMVLGDVPTSSLTITIDPSAPLAIQLVNQHIGAENPHPQYAMSADLLAEIDARTAEILALSDDLDDEVFAREAADVAMAITVSGKAELAGNNSQIFNAANGVSGKNVVNKDQLDALAETIPEAAALATTSIAGLVEKATQGEMNAGTADKFPSAAEIFSGFSQASDGFVLPEFMGGWKVKWGNTTVADVLPSGSFGMHESVTVITGFSVISTVLIGSLTSAGHCTFTVHRRSFNDNSVTVWIKELASEIQTDAGYWWLAIGK